MRLRVFFSATALLLAFLPLRANADTVHFNFGGGTVSGSITLTYGTATDTKTPSGYEVQGISGTFSDSKLGITNATITGLVPITHATPEPTNLLAPYDFSRFAVATGTDHGSLNFDNLYYPGGSPQTASSYMFHGGFLDIYGVLFGIGGGQVVNLWSNGVLPGATLPDYGVSVATSAVLLDSVPNGVAPAPEPQSLLLLGTGVAGTLLQWRSRKR